MVSIVSLKSGTSIRLSCLIYLLGFYLDDANAFCSRIYEPTAPGYDFTANVDRWGQSGPSKSAADTRTVGKVYVNRLPVFDTSSSRENNSLYRWVNRVHIDTQTDVLSNLLLFSPGEKLNENILVESVRILRDQKYINDADIRVVSDCEDVVDLEVITREVWTMVPEVSFKTVAGESTSRIGFRDSNFLGTGKSISLSYKRDSERDQVMLHYSDRNFRGSRVSIRSHLDDSSDGYTRLIQVSLPFYSLQAERSWGVSIKQQESIAIQYIAGERVSGVKVNEELLDAYLGFSGGLSDGQSVRYRFGVHWEDQSFDDLIDRPSPAVIADDFTLAYPFIEYESIQDKYAVAFNINQIHRVEDLYVGRFLRARFGYSGLDSQRLIFSGEVTETFKAVNKVLLQGGINWSGRWNLDENNIEDGELGLNVEYHRGQTEKRSLVLGFAVGLLKNTGSHRQLTLGAENGLRGFRNHYLTGDTSYLFTAEQRVFTNFEPFGLFNVVFAMFVDSGKAYYRGDNGADPGWMTDIGIGLRLVPSKSDKGHVIHLDLAYPLNTLDGNTSIQFTAELKKTL